MSNNGNFLRTKSYVYGVILLKITSSVTHPYIYICYFFLRDGVNDDMVSSFVML